MATSTSTYSVRETSQDTVIVITQAISKDMLVSYINFMRQRMNLPPLSIDPELNAQAEQQADFLQKHRRIRIDRDRSVFSVIKSDAQFWIRRTQPTARYARGQYKLSTPLIDSEDYLSHVLNHKYTSFGMYLYIGTGEFPVTYTVQIFSEKRGKS